MSTPSPPLPPVPKLAATRSFSRGVEDRYRNLWPDWRACWRFEGFSTGHRGWRSISWASKFYLPLACETMRLDPSKTKTKSQMQMQTQCRLDPACMSQEPVSVMVSPAAFTPLTRIIQLRPKRQSQEQPVDVVDRAGRRR